MNMESGRLAIEKRKFPRIPLEATVRFRRLSNEKEKAQAMADYIQARSHDLSQGGVALVETSHLKRGDLLKVEIDVPGRDEPIKAYSEVMWIKPPAAGEDQNIEIAGVKFMGLRPEDESYLVDLVGRAEDGSDPERNEKARVSEKEFIEKMGRRFQKE